MRRKTRFPRLHGVRCFCRTELCESEASDLLSLIDLIEECTVVLVRPKFQHSCDTETERCESACRASPPSCPSLGR